MKEALYWKKLKEEIVQCQLCPRFCVIKEGDRGSCRVRKNVDGKLYSLVYGKPVSAYIDPIEKKPMFHFFPGTTAYSIGTAGCNLHCKFCFTPDTTIITNDGVTEIGALFDSARTEKFTNAECYLRNPNNHTITLTGKSSKIKHVSMRFYDGDMIKIKPYYLPEIKCTPNHQIFVFSGKDIVKKQASEITKNDFLVIPKRIIPKEISQINVKEVLESIELWTKRWEQKITHKKAKQIVKLSEQGATSRQIGDAFCLHPTYVRRFLCDVKKHGLEKLFALQRKKIIEENGKIRIEREKSKGISKIIKIDKNLGRLFGYYCAEGSVGKHRNRPASYYLRFTFGRHERNFVEETKKLLMLVFGIKSKVIKRRTTMEVFCGSSSLALFFNLAAGKGAKNKKVPSFIINAEKEVIKTFLISYIKGDGWYNKEVVSINTVSKHLAYGIFLLFLRAGYLPQFYTWKPRSRKEIEGREVSQSILYYVKLRMSRFGKDLIKSKHAGEGTVKFKENHHYFFVPLFKLVKEHYSGPVYNLEVNPVHSYLANFIAVSNCQNWSISQANPEDIPSIEIPPEKVVEESARNSCKSIAYTYTEPTIFYEYALDTAKLARKKKIKNIMVTNAFINPEPIKEIYSYIDGANIDLKAITEQYYKDICDASLKPVLEAIKLIKKMGVWIELTNLVIPTLNDDMDKIRELCIWIKENVGKDTPLHFSRAFPDYMLRNLPPTPAETLDNAYETAKDAGLNHVYVGNMLSEKENTFCPRCGKRLIKRLGFQVLENNIRKGKCSCSEKIAGIWE